MEPFDFFGVRSPPPAVNIVRPLAPDQMHGDDFPALDETVQYLAQLKLGAEMTFEGSFQLTLTQASMTASFRGQPFDCP
ncbi:MAG: hypothetical protein P4M11_00575 [Candidatus Pacebacteria bacterium]|nr:hypothetical protein [Candidatus Paceibacterota bacterium]